MEVPAFKVTLKLKVENCGSSIPHIYGSIPAIGGGDISKAVPLSVLNDAYNYKFELEVPEDDDQVIWYNYCYKSPLGSMIKESIPKRFLPTIHKPTTIYDIINVPSSGTELSVHFQVEYKTYPGQELFVFGNTPELGSWNKEQAIPLFFTKNSNGTWRGKVQIERPEDLETLEYKYFVNNPSGWQEEETGKPHKLLIAKTQSPATIQINDTFRGPNTLMDSLNRDVFTQVMNRRETVMVPEFVALDKTLPGYTTVHISCVAPQVPTNYQVKVVGSIPALGSWNPHKALPMNDSQFPLWTASISIPLSSIPFEYKFIMVKDSDIKWQKADNNYVYFHDSNMTKTPFPINIISNVWYVEFQDFLPKGMGIYFPIFSIRTETSCGIGQYTDIKQMVDLCNAIGASLMQLLPINDTTDRGEWADSYPYRQVSCFALHPIYIDLLAINGISPEHVEQINQKKWQLERNPTLEYPEVYSFKMRILKEHFEAHKKEIQNNQDVIQFIQDNEKWLKPYSVFCHLRDVYNTSAFEDWPEYSKVTEEDVQNYANENFEKLLFTYWVQYNADVQYKESFNYAREHRVGIKGDLPIGVNLHSVECWYQPHLFHVDMSAGAPPDSFSGAGQNWGFPTYNWDVMAQDGFQWWQDRLRRMSELYNVLRVDHILGFFRIWEIPRNIGESGMLGHYNPCSPVSKDELVSMGLWDIDRYVEPWLPYHVIQEKFGHRAEEIIEKYLEPKGVSENDDQYKFKEEFDCEHKIAKYFEECPEYPEKEHDHACLIQLACNVLLLKDPKRPDMYHPRTEIQRDHLEKQEGGKMVEYISTSFRDLDQETQNKFKELSIDFQYRRQAELWRSKSIPKLNVLKNSTDMLICGEDLGQLTDTILYTLKEFGLLSLRVQRMSKDANDDFDDYHKFQYLSVACPGTHDSPSLRGWWESDQETCRKFWKQVLTNNTPFPAQLPAYVQEQIISQNLWSNSMWAIFLVQDLTSLEPEIASRQKPSEEQINEPSDPNHKWRYRFPFTVKELLSKKRFTRKLFNLAHESKRI